VSLKGGVGRGSLTMAGLMEEAGIRSEGQAAPSQQHDDKPAKDPAAAEKRGKLTKLKEKLHVGKAH